MKILLTGRNGQLGWELERAVMSLGEVVAYDHQSLDLTKPDLIVSRAREVRPDLIVNAAAYTNVDSAEKEPEMAMAINGTAPGVLAEEAKRLGSLLVHYSTDYVFDGTKRSPYTEQDVPNPVNVYGRTKLAGEEAIQASGCQHLILRTAWVYSGRGRNFLLTMLRLANEKPELRVVADQTGAPTWARELAVATRRILNHSSAPRGTLHVTASGETTWFEFAKSIIEISGLQVPVLPIKSEDYPMPAARPGYSVLEISKLTTQLGISMRHWKSGLADCLQEFRAS